MWVVLLDHSGSMGEPFRGSGTFLGRTTIGEGAAKLEEARRALYERVHGLAPGDKVVVIAFTSNASLVFDGTAGQSGELRSALDRLEATNGTSIAAAFDAAAAFLAPMGRTDSRVLLVSDCKSEVDPAVASADRLTQLVHVIDVLLIDPDAATENAARAMIRLGEVQAVVSPEGMRAAVTDRDAISEQLATAMARAIEGAHSAASRALEVRALNEGEPVGTQVGFSAGYAPLLLPGRTAPLIVLVHPAHLKSEVGEVIANLLSGQTSEPRIAADGHSRLPRGAEIRIEPVVSRVRINPARIDVVWQDRIEDFRFTMSAEPDAVGTYALGSVAVWYGPAQIGCLPIAVMISDRQSPSLPAIEASGLFRTVFPSYSRKDKSVVDRARGYYEALGIAVLQDTEALRARAGVNWERALDGLILKADAFQLYWSHSAAASEQVEREWRFANGQSSLKGDRWIRPLRWKDDVPRLPAEIAHLQMGWLPGFEDVRRPRTPAAESIRCTVVPLVDCPPEQVRVVERDCRDAIHHVESSGGVRCYPPPVLLVDEYVLLEEACRSRVIDENIIVRFAAAADVLKALSLDIHTRFGRGELEGKPSPRVDLNLALSDAPRILALSLAEWVFASVADTVLGIHGFVQPRDCGVSKGFPTPVTSRDAPPSARLAEVLSRKTVGAGGITVHFSRDRSQVPDRAIEWLGQTSSGLRIQIEDNEVEVETGQEPLRTVVKCALTPAVARAIDSANPFGLHRSVVDPVELTVFSWLAPTYFRTYSDRIDCAAFAESIGIPGWRTKLESFASAAGHASGGPVQHLERLLQSLQHAFDEVETAYGSRSEFVTGYGLSARALDEVGAREVRPELRGSGSWTHMVGTIPALKRLFAQATEIFLDTLRAAESKIEAGAPSTLGEAHTYGVFIPAGQNADRQLAAWAAKKGIAEALTFPGSDRVLLCLEAIRRCTQEIHDDGARRLVRRSVLIHQLLHAAISSAVGRDEARQAARRLARNVEESLAVWFEYDAARDTPAMLNLIREYASSGAYPAWPYAGMAAIESAFASGGRDAIQSLTQKLIADPETLQSAFDELAAKETLGQ